MGINKTAKKVVFGFLVAFATCMTLGAGATVPKSTVVEASPMFATASVDASSVLATLPIHGNAIHITLSGGKHIWQLYDCNNPVVDGKPLYEP